MRLRLKSFFAALLLCQSSHAQGFVDLNFESATNNTIPGWTAYFGASSLEIIPYNALSLGGANVSLIDTNNSSGLRPLRGRYSVLLEGSGLGTPTVAALGQTGQIPVSALSMSFLFRSLNGELQVSFNGQPIPLFQTGSTTNYAILSGDVSVFAGQTGQLLFSASPIHNAGFLDNIQFSSAPIPEPSALALVALGCGLFGFRHWRRISKT
jgi:PEP-CTERM motif